MKTLKFSFYGFLLLLSGTWLLADTLAPDPFNYFSFRAVFVQYTGIIAIATMSLAMILAIRLKLIERKLGGLDKMYRLHKWLGITALVSAVVHGWWAMGTKWMVGWGWLTRPARKPMPDQQFSTLEQWLSSQRGLAELVGEWGCYIAVILIVLALVKRFPYHLFRKSHYWLAITYLFLVFHSVILIKPAYWQQPIGWVMVILLIGGIISAVLVLSDSVGARRKAQGVIDSLTYYSDLKVLEGTLRLSTDWQGHRPGQFAFLTSCQHEGPHPYTIASAWDPEQPLLTFFAKELGDWTGQLNDRLKVGQPVSIEGPYGCFDFDDRRPRQIWVSAGIGITPFLARMEHLASSPEEQVIDLFHATSGFNQKAIDKLIAAAKAANVCLHIVETRKVGRLTPEQVRAAIPDWRLASFWYCGPTDFGSRLYQDLSSNGLPSRDFHQELFDMR